MSMKLHTGLAALAITLGLIACTPDDPLTPSTSSRRAAQPPSLAVVDGTNGGDDAFRWLPPFSPTADYEGTNDATAAPSIEICVLSGADCTTVATSGVNLPTPDAVPAKKDDGAHFKLSWKTNLYALDPAKTYRVIVRRGTTQQGFADIDVVPTPADLANVSPGFVGVAKGDVLDIKFRLVRGVLRTWLGGATEKGKNANSASATDWTNAGNWSPEGVPFRLDTIHVAAAADQPVLTVSDTVRRIWVMDGATLSMGAFNLTVTSNASTSGTGKITSTIGFVDLAGSGIIGGTLPRLVVSGTYALASDVTTPGTTRLARGQLMTAGNLLKVTP